ncbi:Selenoprotein F [Halotydeus destructor]|nr:Selenoprotein F [Halotydeus destructor]
MFDGFVMTNLVVTGILLAILCQIAVVVAEEVSTEECLAVGFKKDNLKCSRCKELSEFDLAELKDSCDKCCQPDSGSESVKKYKKATLEVCNCNLGHFPQIQAFVKSDRPKKFPKLSVRYVGGTLPVIKLLTEDGEIEEMSVQKWDTVTVEEFLKEHL